MREFKFRAWENGVMYYQVRCGGSFDDIPTAPTHWTGSGWSNLSGQPHTKIMQYTGLKDAEGNEIYEGDILSNNEHAVWVVFYDNGSFKVERISKIAKTIWDLGLYNRAPSTVIGNIFENPEILDKIK